MREKTKDEIVAIVEEVLRGNRFILSHLNDGIRHDLNELEFSTYGRLQKLEQLTNANDYEYITETKLIKKSKPKTTNLTATETIKKSKKDIK